MIKILIFIAVSSLALLILGMVGLCNVIAYDLILQGDVFGAIFMGLVSLFLDSISLILIINSLKEIYEYISKITKI